MPEITSALEKTFAAPIADAAAAEKSVSANAEYVVGELAKFEGYAKTDFSILWAHKALVMFDVMLIGLAFVAGRYS